MAGCEKRETPPAGKPLVAAPQQAELENAWFSYYIGPLCVGYENRVIQQRDGGVRISVDYRLNVNRFDAPTSAEVKHTETLTPEGELLTFLSLVNSGGEPMQSEGYSRPEDGALDLRIHTFGKTQEKKLPVPLAEGEVLHGGYAVEFLLGRKPLKPGEKRTFLRVEPSPVALCFLRVEMECLPSEHVDFPDGRRVALYPVKVVSRMAPKDQGVVQEETFWVDGKGLVWKRYSGMMDLTFWRVTQAEALENLEKKTDVPAETLDFGAAVSVPIKDFDAAAWADSGALPEMTYRVVARDGKTLDFAGLFEESEHQARRVVKAEDGRETLEITVFRSDTPVRAGFQSPAAVEKDLAANTLIQSDAPRVRELAEMCAAEETEPLKIARALEKFVYGFITDKNYSRGFVTAAEVVELPSGDCTEHAVLFAALARARGIPTRVAQGVVLVPQEGKFVWHVWNECHIGGVWVPLDATVGQGVVGVGHLRVNSSDFDAGTLMETLMPVARVVGKIEVELGDTEITE